MNIMKNNSKNEAPLSGMQSGRESSNREILRIWSFQEKLGMNYLIISYPCERIIARQFASFRQKQRVAFWSTASCPLFLFSHLNKFRTDM